VTTENLGFDQAEVSSIAFQAGSVRLWFRMGGSYLEISGKWAVTWQGGETAVYDTDLAGRDPQTPRLIDALAQAHILTAIADTETSVLDVEFDSGLKVHFEPTDGPYEEWEAFNQAGRTYFAMPNNELNWYPAEKEAVSPDAPAESAGHADVEWYEATAPRVVDLDLSDRVYGVTVHAESVQLETRVGTVFFAGPFTVTEPSGTTWRFDPKDKSADANTGKVLDLLIDNSIDLAALTAQTSELRVTFADGTRLDWSAASKGQGHFMARQRGGRQFWSGDDGGVFWYGGSKGTHPKFLVGGPKKTDRTD
jgi:hypothetical protein